jgi:hypothetical protein
MEKWGVWPQGTVVNILIGLPANSGKDVKMHGVFQAFVNKKILVNQADVNIRYILET